MSRITEQLAAVGESIEDGLRQLADDKDTAMQLSAIRTTQLTEKQLADDRWETMNRKLDQVLALLGTNGSGGHHD